jgi:hypothetical protein
VTAECGNCGTTHTPLWVSSIHVRIQPEQCSDVVYFLFINIRLQAVRNATAVTLLRHCCGGGGNGLQCVRTHFSIAYPQSYSQSHSKSSSTCDLYVSTHFSLESVLPIWSSSVQSPRLQPDARVSSFYITSLIPVLLSRGPLCTFLRLILLAFTKLMVPRPCPALSSL